MNVLGTTKLFPTKGATSGPTAQKLTIGFKENGLGNPALMNNTYISIQFIGRMKHTVHDHCPKEKTELVTFQAVDHLPCPVVPVHCCK
jgi:hypothetical protein